MIGNLVEKILVEEYDIEQVIGEWQHSQKDFATLRMGVIHGDFYEDNILATEKRCVAVVDFSDSLNSWYAADVAIALLHLVYTRPQAAKQASLFLMAYQQTFPLPQNAITLLPLLMKMRAATLIVETACDYGGHPPAEDIETVQDILTALNLLCAS